MQIKKPPLMRKLDLLQIYYLNKFDLPRNVRTSANDEILTLRLQFKLILLYEMKKPACEAGLVGKYSYGSRCLPVGHRLSNYIPRCLCNNLLSAPLRLGGLTIGNMS